MKIVLVSPFVHNYPGEAQIVTELFKRGLQSYHLDKPYYKNSTMADFISQIPSSFHNRIMLHSNHELARQFNVAGVHYESLSVKNGLAEWWKDKRLSPYLRKKEKSTRCIMLHELQNIPLEYSYVIYALEPEVIEGNEVTTQLESIRATLQKSSMRTLAMGENGPGYIGRALSLGFYGVVLNKSVWEQPDPVVAYDQIVRTCTEYGFPAAGL